QRAEGRCPQQTDADRSSPIHARRGRIDAGDLVAVKRCRIGEYSAAQADAFRNDWQRELCFRRSIEIGRAAEVVEAAASVGRSRADAVIVETADHAVV